MSAGGSIHFPPFHLNLEQGTLRRDGEIVHLRPKAWALLCHLVAQPGRLFTKNELLEAVWPDAVVSESRLVNSISELRAALGDDPRQARFIEILHRRGYRWIGQIESNPPPIPSRATEAPAASRLPQPDAAAVISVGREHELDWLKARFEAACQGARQIVFVSGEAGIGKTTIVDQLTTALALSGVKHLVGRGQCIEHHGPSEPYLPMLEAISQLAQPGEPVVSLMRQHAPQWLAQLPALLQPSERRALHDETHGASRERMLREMGDFLEVLSERAPIVLVLEDLHWSDSSTIDLIAYLSRRRRPAPVLLVGTIRPVEMVLTNHPLLSLQRDLLSRRQASELRMNFLTEEMVDRYLQIRFPKHDQAADVARVIHARTDGNPLFMAAVTDFMVDQGWIAPMPSGWQLKVPLSHIDEIVPDSLKQMIERQIEQLPPPAIELLEAASIIGMEFSTQALAAAAEIDDEAAERECEALARRQQMLRDAGTITWPDGSVGSRFAFAHGLYRRSLQRHLTPARRQRMHRRVGERLLAGWGQRSEEVSTDLAEHFERGGDHERAVSFLRHSAVRALRQGSSLDAAAFAERALAILDSHPTLQNVAERAQLATAKAAALQAWLGYGHPKVETAFRHALARTEGNDAPIARLYALGGLFGCAYFRAHYDECDRLCAELQSMSHLGLPAVPAVRGMNAQVRGEFEKAREAMEEALTYQGMVTPLGRPHFKVLAGLVLGRVLTILGFPEQGAAADRTALPPERAGAPFDSIIALNGVALRTMLLRDHAATQVAARDALALIDQYGVDYFRPFAAALEAWATLPATPDRAAVIRHSIATRADAGLDGERTVLHWILCSALMDSGDIATAAQVATEAIEFANRTGERWMTADLYRIRAECRMKLNEIEAGESDFREAIARARVQRARWWELRARVSQRRCQLAAFGKADPIDELRDLVASFGEGRETIDVREALALLK